MADMGIRTLCEWDVAVFLYRHGTTLAGAAEIGRLAGYGKGAVVDALDRLESLGFIERSRLSGGVRLYRFKSSTGTAPSAPRLSFEQLVSLAETRSGRLLVIKALVPVRRRDSLHLARRVLHGR